MTITNGLNELSKLALVACDMAYKGLAAVEGEQLTEFLDGPDSGANRLPYSISTGWSVDFRQEDSASGFKLIAFRNVSSNEVMFAFCGVDNTNLLDWKESMQLGWNQWTSEEGGRAAITEYLDQLELENRFPARFVFTGQSLGGALAEYAAFEFVNRLGHTKDQVSLITFNGLGSKDALKLPNYGANDAALVDAFSIAPESVAHYYVTNDLISRLGGGHVGGPTYELAFRSTQTNPQTGKPFLLDPFTAHRIETGFYRQFALGGGATDTDHPYFMQARATSLNPISTTNVQLLVADLVAALGGRSSSSLAAEYRLKGSVILAFRDTPKEYLQDLAEPLILALYNSGVISLGQYDFLSRQGINALKSFANAKQGEAIRYLLSAAVMEKLGVNEIPTSEDFLRVRELLQDDATFGGFGAAFYSSNAKAQRALAFATGVKLVNPDHPEDKALLERLGIDPTELTSRLATSPDWNRGVTGYLFERLNAQQDDLSTLAGLAGSFLSKQLLGSAKDLRDRGLDAAGDLVSQAKNQALEAMHGLVGAAANAFVELSRKITNVIYELRSPISGWKEFSLLPMTLEAQLNLVRGDSSLEEVMQEALDIVESAGQTVVISEGRSQNPFEDPIFDPDAASLPQAEVKEGGIKRFTLALPYGAGEGGQRIVIALEGAAASNAKLIANGEEILAQEGVYTVTVAEGQRELELGVWAQVDAVEDGELSLSATLVDAAGQATHLTHIEANVSFLVRNERLFEGAPDLAGDNSQFALIQGGVTGQRGLYIDFQGGDDIIWADAAEDRLIGGAGNDRLYGSFRTYFNAYDRDWLSGGSGDDWLLGHEGDDILEGDSGADLLLGDLGDDFLFGNNKSDYATIFTVGGGDAEGDLLQGGAGRDLVVGSAGEDDISGGNDADLIMGGAGSDEIRGDTEFTPTHSFLIHGVTFPPEQPLTAGADVIYGNAGSDVIFGEGANDLLYGGEGSDTLTGGEGSDELYGGTGNDILIADSGSAGSGQGNDYLDGGEGDDQLRGENGSDTLVGGRGSDRLEGGEGGDSYAFSAGDGKDTIVEQGVSGLDVLVLDDHARTDITIARLVNGSIRLVGANGDSITIAGVSLGPFGIDRLQFADGTSLSGAELIAASLIDENSIEGPGWERFSDADDTIVAANLPSADETGFVLVDAGPGDDTVDGGFGATVFGNDGNDILFGGRMLLGGRGNDSLSSAPMLMGGAGNDDLRDGEVLVGGEGNDFLDGGAGADRYQFKSGEPGVDVIADTHGGLPPEELADWYYPSIGIADWRSMLGEPETEERLTLEEAIAAGHLPPLPVTAANDYVALEPLYATGAIEMDTVELPEGLVLEDITAEVDDTESTLTLTWSERHSIRVMLAAATDPLGTGIERFRFADGTTLTLAEMLAWEGPPPVPPILGTDDDDLLFGTPDSDRVLGLGGNDQIVGAEGDDELSGNDGHDNLLGDFDNDRLFGGSGADNLVGGPGNDVLAGGPGQDFLDGGDGDDEYVFAAGDGVDYVLQGGGADSVRFAGAIVPGDVAITSDPYGTLHIVLNESDDRVVLYGWLEDGATRVESLAFVDGTIWDATEIQSRIEGLSPTEFGDVLMQTASNDTADGLGGNDEIFGLAGDDVLAGGADGDYLEGNAGNDILRGGAGSDGLSEWQGNNLLDGGMGDDGIFADGAPNNSDGGTNFIIGGSGDDWIESRAEGNVIAFNPGDGHDTVYAVNALTLSLGGGIEPSDLALSQDGDDLVLSIGADDLIRLTRQSESDPQAWPQTTLQMFGSVHFYDFSAVIAEFQAALAADPVLTTFALDGVLQSHETSVSETEALGGVLAYQYGTTGNLNGMGDAAIRQVLGGENFGSVLQDIEVPGGNQAPVIAAPLQDQEAQEDALFAFTLPAETFIDADVDDVPTYSASLANDDPLPSWLTFDAGSRTFSGIPANGDVGDLAVKVTATDPSGASVSDEFEVTVTNTNDAPTINVPIADQSATVGMPFGLALPGNAFVDIDQEEILTYGATLADAEPLPGWLSFNSASLTFTGTPAPDDTGNLLVRVTATDLAGAVAMDEFEIFVSGNAQGVHLVGTPDNDALTGTNHDDVLEGLNGRDGLEGLGGNDLLKGGRGRDQLFGGDGQDVLYGERGRDELYGGAGDDLLAGGRGNDRLEAGVGDDIYVHEKHDGHDVIAETGGTDSLLFGEGIAPGMARLRRHHNDLVVDLSGPHGSVTVKGWFASNAKRVEVIRFDDGTAWNTEEILDRANGHGAWWHGDDRGNRHTDRGDSYDGKTHNSYNGRDDDPSRRRGDPVAEYLAAYLADKPRYDFEALARDLEASGREGGETLTAGEIARRWQQVARFGAALSNEHDGNTYGAGYRLDLGLSAGLGIGGALSHARSTGVTRDGANLRTFSGLEEGFHRLLP